MRIKNTSAFTLIEMLLVVAIISLLISLLLPALKFTGAKNTRCSTNLSLIYGATVSFSISNRGLVPGGRSWVGGDWTNIDSVRNGTLYSYMGKNEAAYVCPIFVESKSWWLPAFQTKTAAFSYSLNEYAGNDWQGKTGVRVLSKAEEPSKLFMFGDENAWLVPTLSKYTINNGAMGVGGWGAASSIVDCIGSFHNAPSGNLNDGFGNVLFFDGHSEFVHVSKTKDVVTPRRYKF